MSRYSYRCFIPLLLALVLALIASADQPGAPAAPAAAAPVTAPLPPVPAEYGDSYTPEELAALDTALHAANMDRTDLEFKKDFAKGYECFPVVREMMAQPLYIAPWMDNFAAAGNASGLGTLPTATQVMLACYTLVAGAAADLSSNPRISLTAQSASFQPLTPQSAAPSLMNPAGIKSSQQLLTALTALAGSPVATGLPAEGYDKLREFLPLAMAWHDVFPRTVDDEQHKKWEEEDKTAPPDAFYKALAPLNETGLLAQYNQAFGFPVEKLKDLPQAIWPDQPQIIDTEFGRIGLGTLGDDEWQGDFAVLLDPGGNDHYKNCRIGAAYGARTHAARLGPDGEPTGASADYSPLGDGRIAFFADLGGDDFYDCADTDITLGAAVLGIAAFYDLGAGNDRYLAGSGTLGSAMGGIATFYDDGGSDYYSGKTYTQGAAGFGIGLMLDDSVQAPPNVPTDVETPEPIDLHAFDNDYYTAWTNAQAFARTRGVAVCLNRRGNEVYHAGGVYLDAPLFSDRYQSFSQGFAIGEREIDYAGGIAMLVDYAGNDRYLGDIYNQGVGYWYSAGFVWDGAGNDSYEMTQYGQGSGIHLAIGGLIDGAGNDTYVMHSGLGQGGSHDFAASVMMDRGGNDHYMGLTSCNGTGLTNSVGMFFDRSGDDIYAGRRDGMMNGGRPDRNTGSIGLFVDLSGNDDYLSPAMKDGGVWTQTIYGMGVDITPPPAPEAEFKSDGAANAVSGKAPIPEICNYKGELDQKVFDELWEISVRWEVGDNRYIVPEARKRLIAFGPAVLAFMDAKMDNDNSGLAERAYVDILKALDTDNHNAVADLLRSNAAKDNDTRRNVALYLIGELKLADLADAVTPLLDNPDQALQRRAMGVLGQLGSHAADDKLIALIVSDADESVLRVALTTLTDLEVPCYDKLRPLLDHPMVTLREALINQLIKHWAVYGGEVVQDVNTVGMWLGPETIGEQAPPVLGSLRAQRTLLTVLSRAETMPDLPCSEAVSRMLTNADWGMRADAMRVVRHWQKLSADKPELAPALNPIVDALEAQLASETDPYVKYVAGLPGV